jgi:hypothetical protein
MQPTHLLYLPNTGASTQLLAGALAQLAAHLGSTCPRAARRASLLLAQIAADSSTDAQLRLQADALRVILDDDGCESRLAGRKQTLTEARR